MKRAQEEEIKTREIELEEDKVANEVAEKLVENTIKNNGKHNRAEEVKHNEEIALANYIKEQENIVAQNTEIARERQQERKVHEPADPIKKPQPRVITSKDKRSNSSQLTVIGVVVAAIAIAGIGYYISTKKK